MILSTLEYFNLRAKRYNNALAQIENARILDLIPYSFFIDKFFAGKKNLKILDAFGGTGFLTKYLINVASEVVVADLSDKMMDYIDDNHKIKKRITTNNFDDIIKEYGEGYFDLVVTHGGIHHSILTNNNNKVDAYRSQNRQNIIVKKLSSLTKKKGILILADLAQDQLEDFSIIDSNDFSIQKLTNILSHKEIKFISTKLDIDLNQQFSYIEFLTKIQDLYSTKTKYKVPHYFFDSYISPYSKLGHIAYYSNFKTLEKNIKGFTHLSRSSFKLPWIFESPYAAGWFFKEKFSIFKQTDNIKTSTDEIKMFHRLEKYLGCKEINNKTFVNWGVTYSILQKL